MNNKNETDKKDTGSKEKKHSSYYRPHRHHHARDTIQSAIQLQHPFSFDNYNPLRRTHDHHHHRLRRGHSPDKASVTKEAAEQTQEPPEEPPKPQWSPEVEYAVDHPPHRLVNPATVAFQRQLRQKRQDHVSSALNALSRDAHTTTRKLDDTYYALLEKLGLLKATIASFQHLHTYLVDTKNDFSSRSDALSNDITSQIDAFQNMSDQDETIQQLVTRLHKSKQRADTFESRLESCRLRLEQWEKKEQEKRSRNNQRWALSGTALFALFFLVIAVVLWKRGSLVTVTDTPSEWKEALGLETNRITPGIRLVDESAEKMQAKEAAAWDRLLNEL
jgi:hypothetical protein